MEMRFDVEVPTCREGMFVPIPFAGPDGIIELIQLAERLGYYAVWGTDFMNPLARLPEPTSRHPNWYELMLSLAYASAVTEKIKLAAGVILLPYRDPIILAKQAATLDQFSNGRFLLGLGLGDRPEFESINPRRARAHRGRMFEEKLEALRKLLAHDQGEVSYKGEYVEFEGVNLNPKPVQDPLPIYAPGRTSDAVRRVAEFGLGYMVRAFNAKERMDTLRPALEEVGRDLFQVDIVAEAQLSIADSHQAAVEHYKSSVLGQRNQASDQANLQSLVRDNWIGTPEEIVEKMARNKREGISHFLALHVAGDSVEAQKEQMHRFAEEVVPQVRFA